MRKLIIVALLTSLVAACDAGKQSAEPYAASPSGDVGAPQARSAFDIDVTGAKVIDIAVPTDTGVASARFAALKPGFAGTVYGVTTFARTRSGTLAGSVKVAGKTAVATLTFGIDSLKAMTLLPDSVTFSATDSIGIYLATTGAGTVKQGHVILKIKPRY